MVSLVLRAGPLEVELAPALGGSIARFDYVDGSVRQPLFRAAPAGADTVLAMASFPLVPFANRIRGGRFDCDGITVTLAPNLAGDPSPLHGQGWLAPWQVAATGERTARLHFSHSPAEWPWHYEAWQDFALDPDGLTVTLGCRNLSGRRMPCALALHPYFPCDATTVLDLDVASVWTVDENTLPVADVAATGRYSLRNRRICGTGLDNGFEGWNGSARVTWQGQPAALTMSTSDATRFQVYSPPGLPYFAAEPVQNANAALNAPQVDWHARGIALLEQGRCREMKVRFATHRVIDDR